jgi:hypothetical protein
VTKSANIFSYMGKRYSAPEHKIADMSHWILLLLTTDEAACAVGRRKI